MSQNRTFKTDSPEVSRFLAEPQGNPLDRLKNFQEALEKPDGPPIASNPVQLRPIEQQVPVRQPEQSRDSNSMSIEVMEREPGKNGRPLHGKKPKVEKTYAIDDEVHRRLIEISNWEGIRHGKKFSVSHIMGHLLEYALSHVEGTNVIPIDGAEGLVIETGETAR